MKSPETNRMFVFLFRMENVHLEDSDMVKDHIRVIVVVLNDFWG